MNRRRRLLGAIGAAFVSGCLGTGGRDDDVSEGGSTAEPTSLPSPENGDLRVSKTVSDDSYTYLEETDEVRYVAGYTAGGRSGEEKVYDTVSFSTWAKAEADEIASRKLWTFIDSRTAVSPLEIEISSERSTLTVYRVTRVNVDDEVVLTPSIEAEDLAEVLPRELFVKLALEGRSYETRYAVAMSRTTVSEGA